MSTGKESISLDQLHGAKPPVRLHSSVHLDGIANTKTGVGTSRDKSSGTYFAPQPLSVEASTALMEASDIATKIIHLPAEEMTREGFNIRVPDDHEGAEKITAAMVDLGVLEAYREALTKKRGFGGALIMVNATDGQTDPSTPLNEKSLISIDSLTVFEPGEAQAQAFGGNPADGRTYGKPASWLINPRIMGGPPSLDPSKPSQNAAPVSTMFRNVHPSRVIVLSGPIFSRTRTNTNYGFGSSVLDRIWQVISRYDQNFQSAGALIDDFAQAVFKIRGLYKSMANDRGAAIKQRLELIDQYRSTLRGIALDAEGEDFDRKATPVSGLDGLLDRFMVRLAQAADMPLTVLAGKSPSGLAASGDNDTRMWYDEIKKAQSLDMNPGLTRLVKLICLSKQGPTGGKVPDDWSISHNALWQETKGEQATTRKTMADADQVYLANGVVSAEEIRQSRFGGDEYSVDTSIECDTEGDDEADDLAESEGVTTGVDPEGKPIMTPIGQPPEGAAPRGPAGAPGAGGGASLQDTALNGTQVSSMIEVVTSVVKGMIPRESGKAILIRAFRVSDQEAEEILGHDGFKPAPDPIEEAKAEALKNPKPAPGGFPAPKAAKPPAE